MLEYDVEPRFGLKGRIIEYVKHIFWSAQMQKVRWIKLSRAWRA